MMPSAPASTWAGRPDVSDIENFWTAPLADRAAAFAALREREPVSFFSEPEMSLLPRGPGYWALTRLDDVVEASRNPKILPSVRAPPVSTTSPPRSSSSSTAR